MTSLNNEDAMIQTLISYKKLACDPCKHALMMKDKTIIQFLAYCLDSDDEEVIELSLETMEMLINNSKNQNPIRSTFGIIEALKLTSERADISLELKNLARDLCRSLEASDGPAFSTRSRTKTTITTDPSNIYCPKISASVYTFHVFGLNNETRFDLENVLIRIKGVISVLVDVDHQRCIVRTVDHMSPEFIAETVTKKTKMEPHLVIHNKNHQEVLKDVLKKGAEQDTSTDDLPPYLAEEESPVKEKAILTFDRIRTNATSLIRTAAEFFQNSFYW